MSFLGRLFGRGEAPAPSANSVVIPDDLATALTSDGVALSEAVETALRALIDLRARTADEATGRIPFWLARDADTQGGIEEELRDRLAQRRAAETDEPRRGRGRTAED